MREMQMFTYCLIVAALVLLLSGGAYCTKKVKVSLGNELLRANNYAILKGQRVAFLSNPTGVYVDSLVHIVDDMYNNPNVEMVAIFSPEHGFRGEKQAETGDDLVYIDAQTQLPVFSAYKLSLANMTDLMNKLNITTVVVDMQDVGVRLYTFIWTMFQVMQAAATTASPTTVIVCDRPNPLGSLISGPLLNMSCCSSGYGRSNIPHVHGMTIGELSLYFNKNSNNDAEVGHIKPALQNLVVLQMQGWSRDMLFADTGLPWVVPSPNIPTPASAIAYVATVFLEATTAAEGRGTTTPFQLFGAPFVTARALASTLNGAMKDEDYPLLNCFREAYFEPTFSKYNGSVVNGVQWIEQRCTSNFEAAVNVLVAIKSLSSPASEFVWDGSWFGHPGTILIDEYAGTPQLREMIDNNVPVEDIVKHFKPDEDLFREMRKSSLLY